MRDLPFWYPPILTYHRIHPTPSSETPTLSPEEFEKQMKLLSERWKPSRLSTLAGALEGKEHFPPRGVVVTFDDGTEDTYTHAFPILSQYRIPAAVFLIAGNVGKEGFVKPQQIARMDREGITFGSHCLNHEYLPSLTPEQAEYSILLSKKHLERLGIPVEFISFPGGGFTRQVIEAVQRAGYRAACTTNRGFRRFPVDRWALRRVSIHSGAASRFGIWLRCCGYYGLNRRLRSPS